MGEERTITDALDDMLQRVPMPRIGIVNIETGETVEITVGPWLRSVEFAGGWTYARPASFRYELTFRVGYDGDRPLRKRPELVLLGSGEKLPDGRRAYAFEED